MARFLRETIESVLAQDYPRIEYIVMDNASTDDTRAILESFGGRLRWFSEPDQGQADAINRGFARCSGEYFGFLNADDTYLPGAIRTAVAELQKSAGSPAIYGEALHVAEDGSAIGRYPTEPFQMERLNYVCFVCQPATLMRSAAFRAAGLMNEKLHLTLDYDLWIRLARLGPLLHTPEVLATSRMYKENKTLSQRSRLFEEAVVLLRAHFGYVPYGWVYDYAAHRLGGPDTFFERKETPLATVPLSLLLGSYYNQRNLARFWAEAWRHLAHGRR